VTAVQSANGVTEVIGLMSRTANSDAQAVSVEGPRFKIGGEIVGPVTATPQRYKKSESVQKKLLDTAEALFARWGYAAVSIRDVTSLAQMRVANVSYFFGSKENLYFEVLRRRAEPLARLRLDRLREARAAAISREAKLSALIAAYADPPLELSQSGDPGWKNFFSLIGQITFSGFAAPEIAEFFNEPARELMRGFQDLYPAAPPARVQAAALLLIGPYIMVIGETGRIETFPERAFSSGDLAVLGPFMKEFIVGGVRGVLESVDSTTTDRKNKRSKSLRSRAR
jgi:AcrR family transcriptional regulator